MPVNLKLVRSDPDLVKSWQRHRQLSVTAVDDVLEFDTLCRSALKDLSDARSALKKMKKGMRRKNDPDGASRQPVSVVEESTASSPPLPSTSPRQASSVISEHESGDAKSLVQEQQAKIRQLERAWKEATARVNTLLDRLASQVDPKTLDPNYQDSLQTLLEEARNSLSMKENEMCGPAVASVAARYGQQYSVVRSRSIRLAHPEELPQVKVACIRSDKGEWLLSSDFLRSALGVDQPHQSSSGEPLAYQIPSWIAHAAYHFKKKSIYGDSQLPQYVCLWEADNDLDSPTSISVVAMTSGTLFDSRAVQQSMLVSHVETVSDLLLGSGFCSGSDLNVRVEPPPQLSHHEISRLSVECAGRDLFTVSNFGDAASRAMNIQFANGDDIQGECIHFVVATLHLDNIASLVGDKILAYFSSDRFQFWDEQKGSGYKKLRGVEMSVRNDDDSPMPTEPTVGAFTSHLSQAARLESLSCPFGFIF